MFLTNPDCHTVSIWLNPPGSHCITLKHFGTIYYSRHALERNDTTTPECINEERSGPHSAPHNLENMWNSLSDKTNNPSCLSTCFPDECVMYSLTKSSLSPMSPTKIGFVVDCSVIQICRPALNHVRDLFILFHKSNLLQTSGFVVE